ncbi:universal stress protein [Actinomadura madurae]|nr:universal stress protein [Actinomadura madurae]MCP9964944.1 universal stress protein [Actinomadura madurae]MCP9977435.1 universal stress protein [Actinomadura madurae]MCQ0011062.1 universal stress protein [Actinomadura madurae]MCQ0013617.1 universal stress protein [Actinomadura madurae]
MDWAADEAARRGASLHVVYVGTPCLFDVPTDPGAARGREQLLDGGRDIVELGVTRARERVPGLKVTGEQTGGQPAKVLIERARDARMVVTGSRGAGRLTGLVLGSVAMQVASHAHCPAVVVRASKPSVYREVVVGVDGSTGSSDAVAFAFEEASLRGVRLRALLAWSSPVSTGPGDMRPLVYDRDVVAVEEERVLGEALAGWRAKYPDVVVMPEAVHGRAVKVLAEASVHADLLVVGSRGRGGFTGLLLGSVSQALLLRANCPVTVVRAHP